MPTMTRRAVAHGATATIALELKSLWDETDQLQRVQSANRDRAGMALATAAENAEKTVWFRISALEDWLAMSRAEDAAGALAQIMLASNMVDWLKNETEGSQASKDARQVQLCLYSIRAFLERLSTLSADQLGAKVYMDRRFDPHLALDHAKRRAGKGGAA